jgi:4'-phosphopantetheinyl transferase
MNLDEKTVDVWWGSVSTLATALARWEGVLSAEERARAARYHFEKDRRRSIVSRGVLRHLLSGYVGVAPAALRFAVSRYGKLSLEPSAVWFNVSHSADSIIYAITTIGPVGIDIEQVRPLSDRELVAHRVFSPREWASYDTTPEPLRDQQFFHGWTRKEAFIKAIGEGLSHPLDAFDVALTSGAPAQLLAINGDRAAAAAWTLQDIAVEPPYVAALALRSLAVTVVLRPLSAFFAT